jgi:hypothetical protein
MVLGLVLVASAGFALEEHPNARETLRAHPPRMRSLQMQQIDANTVRVFVDYERDPRLGNTVTLNLARGPVKFERGDDGRYAGDVPLAAEDRRSFLERDRRVAKLGPRAVHFEYDGRMQVGSVLVSPVNWEPIVAGASDKTRVSVPVAYASIGALAGDPMSVLTITDLAVVADSGRTWDPCAPSAGTKNGKWTFGYLIRNLAGAGAAAQFTADWLANWTTSKTVNGVTVAPRPRMTTEVLDKWPRVAGALDLDQAPFRLLAIVNRIDLAQNLNFGTGPGPGGEVRFVFDVAPWQTSAGSPGCSVLRFQVILEYAITASSCADVRDWAQRWINLGQLPRGSPAFNDALEAITEDLVTGKKGALAQIRTNEIGLANSIGGRTLWEMREFKLSGGKLVEASVRRTPVDSSNRTADLSKWVNANATNIKNEAYEVLSGGPLQPGANPQMESETFWDGPRGPGQVEITEPEARFKFSLNTCSGCHARETCTAFNQVIGGPPHGAASLSPFLAGGQVVPDPVTCPQHQCAPAPAAWCPPSTPSPSPPVMGSATASPLAQVDPCCRQPADLARRLQVLDQLASCIVPYDYQPLNMAH